jgi:hypothetical protein
MQDPMTPLPGADDTQIASVKGAKASKGSKGKKGTGKKARTLKTKVVYNDTKLGGGADQ